jgi:hypothetical protein
MLTEQKSSQALELWPVNARKRAGTGYCTDLAVDFGRKAEIDQRTTYGHEAGQARNGVDLTKGDIQTRVIQSKAVSSRTHIVHR